MRQTLEAIAAVAAVQAGGLAACALGASQGYSLTIAGAVVQIALIAWWFVRRADSRDLCRELVIEGAHDGSQLGEVAREHRRLRSPRFQARLAARLEAWARLASRPHAPLERHRAIYSPRVVAAVAPQLRDVAARLRAGGAELRGVALLDRLLTAGSSPLYGKRVRPLREQLARARMLLG